MKLIEIARAQVISEAPSLAELGLNFLQFLLRIFGIIVIISLVISGILYFISGGNEDMIRVAKKAMFYSIVGAIVGLGAFLIIRQISAVLN
ncbi:MAG: hypothetical protein PHH24_02420 [Candidatus Moranbacteria bacterium]|jgi:hypothetical protein|nr:hypothetical protein [Candidatus Moranbacteria bacterium]MDX9855840.1 hypothetical protein [Candidatus Moranbacteria bacterium]